MAKPLVLQVNNLAKQYGRQTVLSDFNLSIHQGEIVGIAGPNGAGKTTLFRIITGLTPQYEGEVSLFASSDSANLQSARRRLGTIIEDPAFFPEMNARQNLYFYCLQRNVKDKTRIDELLTLVGLADVGKKKVKSFSLGMKQRLAIALSLIHQPEILVFDEPTNGLDPKGIVQVRELLKQLAAETNLTILVSSHILSELENLATRFVIMNQGRKIEEFTKDTLRDRVQNYLEIKVDQIERAIPLLLELIPNIEIQQEADGIIKLFSSNIEASAIADKLVKNDIKLSHLARRTYHLEELFIDLTEEGDYNA